MLCHANYSFHSWIASVSKLTFPDEVHRICAVTAFFGYPDFCGCEMRMAHAIYVLISAEQLSIENLLYGVEKIISVNHSIKFYWYCEFMSSRFHWIIFAGLCSFVFRISLALTTFWNIHALTRFISANKNIIQQQWSKNLFRPLYEWSW